MSLADMTGDGLADLITPNPDHVAVLVAEEDGGFRPRATLPARLGPFSVVAADLNGDDRQNVAAASGEGAGSLATWHGLADGSFRAVDRYEIARGPTRSAAADLGPVFDSLGETRSSLVLRILTDPGAFSFIQRLVGSTAVTSCGADLRALTGSVARRRGKSESGVGGLHLSVQQTNRPQSASLPPQLSLVPTILHISDLHRTAGPQLSNDELLPALVSDAIRWRAEGIPRPDLVAVSGDLVQGVALDAPDADSEIDAQYREVGDFLAELSDEFLDGDRSRMVIVPGNHDVHWRRSLDGMKPIDQCPDDIATKALQPTSGLRWHWTDCQAYEISDHELYGSRLEHFRRFQKAFYAGVEPSPFSEDEDLLFVEYPDLDLAVAGFSSWYGNDCLCHVGEIAATSLALSQKRVARSRMATAVAVWHHSIAGGPRSHDYMDQRVVHRLIDFGFTVGLHGHQHYPGAAPFELRLPNLTAMAVVGAGSLAVGDNELPMGERRQFNVVVIDPDRESITVHVRGMSAAGVFTGSHRDDFGGNTFIKLDLPVDRSRGKSSTDWQPLDEAMTAVAERRFEDALELAGRLSPSRQTEKRRIEIESFRGLGRQQQLIEVLDPPLSADELVELIAMLLDAGRVDDANERLHTSRSLLTPSLLRDLSATIKARRTSE